MASALVPVYTGEILTSLDMIRGALFRRINSEVTPFRLCWFRAISYPNGIETIAPWAPGAFHRWGQSHTDCREDGPAPWPCGVVEDRNGAVHVVDASMVNFGEEIPT